MLYVHTFCAPIIATETVTLQCVPENHGFNQSGNLFLTDTSSCTASVDWNTINLNYNTDRLSISTINNVLIIRGKSSIATNTTLVTGTVQNTNGVEGSFSFNIVQPPCQFYRTTYSNR